MPTRCATRRWRRPAWTAPCSPTRATNYELRGAIADYAAPAAILTKPLEIVLPQAYDGWPRSVMAVVDDEETRPSSIMVLTQQDAVVAVQALVPGEPRGVDDDARPRAGLHRGDAGSAGLVVPGHAAGGCGGGVRRHHQQGRGQRVRRACSRPRAITSARASPPTVSSRLDEFNQTAATTGSLTFAVRAGRRTTPSRCYARERRDRRRECRRDRHRQADQRRRGDQTRRTTRP